MKTLGASDPHDGTPWIGAKGQGDGAKALMFLTFERLAVPKVCKLLPHPPCSSAFVSLCLLSVFSLCSHLNVVSICS